MILGDGFRPGEPLASRLSLSDVVLDFEILANRSDLLSVRGIARDVAAVFDLRLRPLDEREPEAIGRPADARAGARVGRGSRAVPALHRACAHRTSGSAPSPLWLKARLTGVGIRPISNVVDVTNYVAHDLGQPLHAYDLARVPGHTLVARRARAGEKLTTLDGKERALDAETLVIAHAEGPSGLAGIMGGADAEISDDATEVVLEAASFERGSILRTTRRLGIRTEASNRFEKGVDPELAPIANRAAARMLVELAGADAGARPDRRARRDRGACAGSCCAPGACAPSPASTSRRARRPRSCERLGFAVERHGDELRVRPPSWRALDVTREIDVVEEVARIYGLEHVPATLPAGARAGRAERGPAAAPPAARGAARRRLQRGADDEPRARRHRASGSGSRRTIRGALPVLLANPLSAEHAALRTLLVPSLADVAARNQALGRQELAIYEIAHLYQPAAGEQLPREPWTAGGLVAGRERLVLHGQGHPRDGLPGGRPRARGRARQRARSVPAPGPRGAHRASAASRRATSASCTRRSPSDFGVSGPVAVVRDRRDAARAARARARDRGARAGHAAAAPGHRGRGGGRAPRRATSSPRARAAGGELLRDVGVFDVYRDEQALRSRRPLAGAAADLPGGRPHADGRRGRAAARGRSSMRWRRGSAPCCADSAAGRASRSAPARSRPCASRSGSRRAASSGRTRPARPRGCRS